MVAGLVSLPGFCHRHHSGEIFSAASACSPNTVTQDCKERGELCSHTHGSSSPILTPPGPVLSRQGEGPAPQIAALGEGQGQFLCPHVLHLTSYGIPGREQEQLQGASPVICYAPLPMCSSCWKAAPAISLVAVGKGSSREDIFSSPMLPHYRQEGARSFLLLSSPRLAHLHPVNTSTLLPREVPSLLTRKVQLGGGQS